MGFEGALSPLRGRKPHSGVEPPTREHRPSISYAVGVTIVPCQWRLGSQVCVANAVTNRHRSGVEAGGAGVLPQPHPLDKCYKWSWNCRSKCQYEAATEMVTMSNEHRNEDDVAAEERNAVTTAVWRTASTGRRERLRRYGTRHRWRGAAPRRRRSASEAAGTTAIDVFKEDPAKDQSDKSPMPCTSHAIIHTFNRIHINAKTNSDANTYRDVTAAMNHSRCRLSAMRGGVIVRRGNNTSNSCLMQYT